MNAFIVVLFALQAIASWSHFMSSGTPRTLGLLVVNTLFVTLFLLRSPAKAESESLGLWALGIAGTVLPLLMRPNDGALLGRTGDILQIAGFALLAVALLSLRRSFGIVAANRGVRSGGLYRFVRHPIYFSELTLILGFALANPTLTNLLIWLCECALQYARARAEEQLLCADPAYQTYLTRVRYRLVPGLI
jgi:protein-S-isoprenylcysteine O-methyltransferase Ste14